MTALCDKRSNRTDTHTPTSGVGMAFFLKVLAGRISISLYTAPDVQYFVSLYNARLY